MNGGRTRHYRDLLVWQKAMGLTKNVYRLTESFPQKETFGLQSRFDGLPFSSPATLQKVTEDWTMVIFASFFAMSRGSLFELQTQLELSADLSYLDAKGPREVMEQSEEVARMLNGLLGSIAKDRGRRAKDVSKLAGPLTR